MKRVVLDSSAVMAFFENRPGAEKVEELIQFAIQRKRELSMSVVNWGEIYYSVWRAKGPGLAMKVLSDIAQLPVELVDVGYDLAKSAAEFHAGYKLPYVDCFAAALAVQRKAVLATADRDFTQIQKKLDILWTV